MASNAMRIAAEKAIAAEGNLEDAINTAILAQVDEKARGKWVSIDGRSVLVASLLKWFDVPEVTP